MSFEAVQASVFQTVKNFEKVDPAAVTRLVSFKQLGLSKFDVLQLIGDIEEALDVELTDQEALKIRTVLDAVSLFHKHKQQPGVVLAEETKTEA